MSTPLEVSPVLLFWSVLYQSSLVEYAQIQKTFEQICAGAPVLIFTHDYFPMKEYYSHEMGEASTLKRLFIFKMAPFHRQDLMAAKKQAMHLESVAAKDGQRTINIDPGTLALDNVVLSTAKPYAHRIYHYDGLYSELCLIFKEDDYHPLEWTYPDYRHRQVLDFFHFVRSFLKSQTPAWQKRLHQK